MRYEDVRFENKEKADSVLGILRNGIRIYSSITIGEFFDIVGERSDCVDDKLGWHDLSKAKVVADGDKWKIDLPQPTDIFY